MPHLRKRRHQRQSQKSPFLSLPSEIRNHIYTTALVSPTPIDLCPADYITAQEHIDGDNILRQRHLAFKSARLEPEEGGRPEEVAFRRQSSLQYVRRHLAVQLLAVCRQIYNEASQYFWGENVWRFSDDQNWEIVLRFLLTIGENARFMIKHLEALIPWPECDGDKLSVSSTNWRIKNEPKLHMVRLLDTTKFSGHWWYDAVWEFLAREKSPHILNLIVPAGYTGGRKLLYWENENMECTTRIQVIVEAGGMLYDKNEIVREGWDVVALRGSLICADRLAPMSGPEHEVKSWGSDLDYLTGMMQLFNLEEDASVHANNGKTRKRLEKIKVERHLTAFGPCMIQVVNIPCECWRCESVPWKSRGINHGLVGTGYKSLVDIHAQEVQEWKEAFDT